MRRWFQYRNGWTPDDIGAISAEGRIPDAAGQRRTAPDGVVGWPRGRSHPPAHRRWRTSPWRRRWCCRNPGVARGTSAVTTGQTTDSRRRAGHRDSAEVHPRGRSARQPIVTDPPVGRGPVAASVIAVHRVGFVRCGSSDEVGVTTVAVLTRGTRSARSRPSSRWRARFRRGTTRHPRRHGCVR
jgi:hypothetical protein